MRERGAILPDHRYNCNDTKCCRCHVCAGFAKASVSSKYNYTSILAEMFFGGLELHKNHMDTKCTDQVRFECCTGSGSKPSLLFSECRVSGCAPPSRQGVRLSILLLVAWGAFNRMNPVCLLAEGKLIL